MRFLKKFQKIQKSFKKFQKIENFRKKSAIFRRTRRRAPTCPAAEPLQARLPCLQAPSGPADPPPGPSGPAGSPGLDKPAPGVADVKHSCLRKAMQKLHAAASRTSRNRIIIQQDKWQYISGQVTGYPRIFFGYQRIGGWICKVML